MSDQQQQNEQSGNITVKMETSSPQLPQQQNQQQQIDELQLENQRLVHELGNWQDCVKELKTAGYLSQNDCNPSKTKEVIHVILAHKAQLESEMKRLYRKEAETQVALGERTMEWLELRKRQATLAQGTEPNIIQLKQCLLDPGVYAEMSRLKSEVEKRDEEIRTVREELQAVTFTPDSKNGRELVKKCKQLQQDCDDLGKELAEGNVQMIKLQVKIKDEEKEHWKQLYYQMEDHATQLEEENEDLGNELYLLKRTGAAYGLEMNGGDEDSRQPLYKAEPRSGKRGLGLISKDKEKSGRYVRQKNSR
eukprot:TRINITY_DN59857_c0_g1_i1.p2 TRINITY_DN59857_c0_g1~~TRINITY_DN59857_c0_g1_i1.p2  ORF type:complete len:307 (-),score=56.94 TRINITY_DN59857_c0_g1_i1:286-1206(-)